MRPLVFTSTTPATDSEVASFGRGVSRVSTLSGDEPTALPVPARPLPVTDAVAVTVALGVSTSAAVIVYTAVQTIVADKGSRAGCAGSQRKSSGVVVAPATAPVAPTSARVELPLLVALRR